MKAHTVFSCLPPTLPPTGSLFLTATTSTLKRCCFHISQSNGFRLRAFHTSLIMCPPSSSSNDSQRCFLS